MLGRDQWRKLVSWNWCGQPMLFAALSFAAGTVLVRVTLATQWRPPISLIVCALALFAIAAWELRRRARFTFCIAMLIFVVMGALDYEFKLALPVKMPAVEFYVPCVLTGTVVHADLPTPRRVTWIEDPRSLKWEIRQSFDLERDAGPLDRKGEPKLRVRIVIHTPINLNADEIEPDEEPDLSEKVSTADKLPQVRYGERLRVETRLRRPRNFNNPGAWDYEGYLADQGIYAVGSTTDSSITLLPGEGGTGWGRARDAVRRSLIGRILGLSSAPKKHFSAKWYEIDRRDAALLIAMTLGERSLLHRDTKTDFQKTGAYHLLVVSGMNVAILAFAVFWTARTLLVGEVSATIFTILLSMFYAWLTDLGAPIQRAVLMSSLYLITRLLYRGREPLNAVGVAALAVLVWDPAQLFDAGFQLTFLAVLTIGGIGIPVLERTSGPYRSALRHMDSSTYDLRVEPRMGQFRVELRMIAQRLERFVPRRTATLCLYGAVGLGIAVFDVLFMSLLMQAALALPMAIYFHRMTVMGLPANIIVVPLISLLMPPALIAAVAGYIGPWAAFVPKLLTTICLHAITGTISLLSRLSAANLRVADPPFWITLACSIALVLCLVTARRRRFAILSAFGCLLLCAALLPYSPSPQIHPRMLEVTAIDVGQGDSLLVVTPEGKTLLIDGGGTQGPVSDFDIGEDVVSPYLWARGFDRLDAVALTHAHGDHMGGLPSVVGNFRPKEFWVAPSEAIPAYRNLMRLASRENATVLRRTAGEKFAFGGTHIEVLWPPADWRPTRKQDANSASMVLRIAYKESSALLEGDAEARAERQIALSRPRAQLLKVGHHGSKTSTIPELMSAAQPEYAVISVGDHNRYGHPTPEVLERLTLAGVHTFRTDAEGAVTFLLDGTRVSSAVIGGRQAQIDLLLLRPR